MPLLVDIIFYAILVLFFILPFILYAYKFFIVVNNKYIKLKSYRYKNSIELKKKIPNLEKSAFKWLGICFVSWIAGTIILVIIMFYLDYKKII